MAELLPRRSIDRIVQDLPLKRLNTIEECERLCDYVGRCVVPDLRAQVWDLRVVSRDPFIVEGYVTNRFGLRALTRVAQELGVSCETGRVAVVPDFSAIEHPFGLITSQVCPIYATRELREVVDTALYGEPVCILRMEDSLAQTQIQNGYIGWMKSFNFRSVTINEWMQWMSHPRGMFFLSLQWDGLSIPASCELPSPTMGQFILPTGTCIKVPRVYFDRPKQESIQRRDVLRTVARSLIGAPYAWGGTSGNGIDCSGFVRHVFKSVGIYLPRDADQQCLCGTVCAYPGLPQLLDTGDLLFFSGEYGGISHVAMVCDKGELIHAQSGKGVYCHPIDENETLMERFVIAKRLTR